MFKMFKKEKNEMKMYAIVSGKTKELEDVPDEMFAKGLMGPGIAIIPNDSNIYAPLDGRVSMIFPGGHALGITTEDGIAILIHIGVDTVSLKGEGFSICVEEGQYVEAGEKLLEVDFDIIKSRGLATDALCIVTEPKEGIACTFIQEKEKKVQSSRDMIGTIHWEK